MIAAAIAFNISRASMGVYAFHELNSSYPMLQTLDAAFQHRGIRVNFLLRVCPLVPTSNMNYALGIVNNCTFGDFIIGAAIGIPPWAVIYVFLGAALSSFSPDTSSLANEWVYWVALVVALVTVVIAMHRTSNELREMAELAPERSPQLATFNGTETSAFAGSKPSLP